MLKTRQALKQFLNCYFQVLTLVACYVNREEIQNLKNLGIGSKFYRYHGVPIPIPIPLVSVFYRYHRYRYQQPYLSQFVFWSVYIMDYNHVISPPPPFTSFIYLVVHTTIDLLLRLLISVSVVSVKYRYQWYRYRYTMVSVKF